MTRGRLLAAVISSAAVLACAARPPGKLSWEAMDSKQRVVFMDSVVVPRMRSIFMEYDPHKYAKMDCFPCHDRDRSAGWRMPNPDLALDVACLEGKATSFYGSEEAAVSMAAMNAFMRERVQPAMAALLGRTSVGPGKKASANEIDCFACHTLDQPTVVLPTVPENYDPQ